MSLPYLENAEETISEVFGDTTVDRKTIRLNLEELRDRIDDFLASLDDDED